MLKYLYSFIMFIGLANDIPSEMFLIESILCSYVCIYIPENSSTFIHMPRPYNYNFMVDSHLALL